MPPPFITLILLLAVALVVSVLGVIHMLASMLLRPPRMTDGKAMYVLKRMSPGDMGLAFEPVEFIVRDHAAGDRPLKIAGWWIPAAFASTQTCILIHGFGDAKVGALAWAELWRELGWNLLLIDLRAHGESGGTRSTGGFHERDDVDAVINDLRARRPAATERIALFGVSLGGAVALATAARRDDIDAVVADSVFADYREAAIVHGQLIRAPIPSVIPLAIRWAEKSASIDFDAVKPTRTIRDCRCPIMLVHGDADPFVPPSEVALLAEAIEAHGDARDVHLHVSDAGHCLAIVADAHNYAASLKAFLAGAEAKVTSSGEASIRG